MTEEEKADHLEQFAHWKSTIVNRIQQWKSTFPASIAEKLDMSAESLVILEQYLVDTFPDHVIFFNPSNNKTIDVVCTYIGEVYRLNLPGKQEWKIEDDKIIEQETAVYTFEYCVGLEGCSWGENPTQLIPFVLHVKLGNKLFEHFINSLTKKFNEAIVAKEKQIEIPGRGGYSYQHFLLLKNDSYRLKELEKSVSNFYAKRPDGPKVYLANEARLVIEFTKEFCFHFWLDDRSYVVPAESKEIAEQYVSNKKNRDVIAAAKTRIEFWGDGDPNGDYFNEHLFLLSELVKLPDFYIFNFKQGVFYDEM